MSRMLSLVIALPIETLNCGASMEALLSPRVSQYNASTGLCITVKEESLDATLDTLELMHCQGIPISRETLFSFLQKCLSKTDILLARRLHGLITNTGFASVPIFQDHLIRLFAVCKSLQEAYQVFSNVCKPSAHTWYAIISACTKCGEGKMALKMFSRMQQVDLKPGIAMLSVVLKACSMVGSFCEGRLLHHQIVEDGVCTDVKLENSLIDMYGKCSQLEDAHKVFDIMVDRDVVSWNALISGYAQHGHCLIPLDLFRRMQSEYIIPCKVTYTCVLKACSSQELIEIGKQIHELLVRSGFEVDTVVGNALIDMYAKSGMLEEAQCILNSLHSRSVVTWGAIIAGFASQGHGLLALKLFDDMLRDGIKPNRVLLSCVLKACTTMDAVCRGMLAHGLIIRMNIESDLVIGNCLVDMYITCGSIEDAHKVFTSMSHRDDVSWNTMIAGYAQQGQYLLALELFQKMQLVLFHLYKPLALCIIKVCTRLGAMVQGMILHLLLLESEDESDAMIQNTLVDMYAKCGSLEDAQKMFDILQDRNLVSWGAIISAYAAHGQGHRAFDLVTQMQQDGKTPNDVIFLSILNVCINIGESGQGRLIHDLIIRAELDSAPLVANMLIHMYSNFGSLDEGQKVFDALPVRDEVSWGVILDGCAQNEAGLLALELFQKMQEEGVRANFIIFMLILKSCGITGSLQQGRVVHDQIIYSGLEAETEMGTTLIDMYGSCGSLSEARRVLNLLPKQDVSVWNALIAGYAQHGHGKLALQCFQDMRGQGFQPDGWTFTSVLAACSHEGQVDKAYDTFALMRENHGLTPSTEHLNCIIDNLARAGCLKEAEEFLQTMPKSPVVTGWLALLTACRTFGNNELGSRCYDEAVCLDPEKASGYMLMSNIRADGHNMSYVGGYHATVWKKPRKVWTEVRSKLRHFVAGERNYLVSDIISSKKVNLSSKTAAGSWTSELVVPDDHLSKGK